MSYTFDSLKDVQRIDRVVNAYERAGPLPLRPHSGAQLNQLALIGLYNSDAVNTIPSFGCVLLQGDQGQKGYPDHTGPAQGVCMAVKRPDAFGCQYNGFIVDEAKGAGYGPVVFGAAQQIPPFIALYDSADGTPAFGERWGPRSGTYKLKKNTGGFLVIGIYDSVKFYALVMPEPMLSVRGTIAADAAPDSSSTLTVFTGAYGAEVTTSQTIASVRNASDCTLKSGGATKVHRAVYDWGVPNGGWEFDVGRTV